MDRIPLDRATFVALRREQIEARKAYDAIVGAATHTDEASGLQVEVLTRENWPLIEAAMARMRKAEDDLLRGLRGEPASQP